MHDDTDADSHLKDGALTRRVIGACFAVHNEPGQGFEESIHGNALAIELEERQVGFAREVPVEVQYRGRRVGGSRCDFLVERRLLVELKAGRELDDGDLAQVLGCMRCNGIGVGLLLHFGERVTVRRFVL